MNAADVLAEAWPTVDGADDFVAALLAHGEQGIAILPDGTLWALEPYIRGVYGDHKHFTILPVSAEAGDTDAT